MTEVSPFENSEQVYSQIVTPVTQSKPRCSVWGGQAQNPTCGLISLEKGAKWFLRIYMYIFIVLILFCVVCLALAGFFAATQDHDILVAHFSNETHFVTTVTEYESAITGGRLAYLVFGLAWMGLTAYSCYKCIQALEQGTVAQMKKHFWVVFCFLVIDVILMIFSNRETILGLIAELFWSTFSVIGILFVYNHILERIQSVGGTLGYPRESTLEPV